MRVTSVESHGSGRVSQERLHVVRRSQETYSFKRNQNYIMSVPTTEEALRDSNAFQSEKESPHESTCNVELRMLERGPFRIERLGLNSEAA